MKRILSLCAIAVLALITSVRAQDESPSAAASPEESASSSLQAPSSLRNTSSSAAEATTTATPAETNKSEASASPAASPQKKAATAAATEKKEKAEEAAGASSAPDKGSPEGNVKRLEEQWEASVMKHDTSFVTARVARDFMGVSSKGKRMDKGALLKEYKADADNYSSARNTGVKVRSYGSNVAVASGVAKEVGKTKDGTPFNRSYVWTDTWVLRGDQWQCVASHVMPASGK